AEPCGVGEFLQGTREGVRDRPGEARSDLGVASERAADSISGAAGEADTRPIHMPGERGGRNREKVRVPARAHGAAAVKLGLISDTHGLLRPVALETLRGSELIIHAGDVGKPEILT